MNKNTKRTATAAAARKLFAGKLLKAFAHDAAAAPAKPTKPLKLATAPGKKTRAAAPFALDTMLQSLTAAPAPAKLTKAAAAKAERAAAKASRDAKNAADKATLAAKKAARKNGDAKPADAKPAAKSARAATVPPCSKCGRQNTRPAGATDGDCASADACKRRRAAAAAAAK